MSTLVLVRHGQGGPLGGFYDRLSEVGEEQSRRLGEYWAAHGIVFDEVYTGTLERQKRTAEVAGERCAAAGITWPETQVVPELNEYDADGVMKHLLPEIASRDAAIRKLRDTYEATTDAKERAPNFQRMFEAIMRYWVRGDHESNGCERWADFRDRVRSGLNQITAAKNGSRRVAVFTSGGPIGVGVQSALGAPDETAVQLNWRVRNSSLTEFVFSGSRFTLEWFNALPHLSAEPGLWTFR